MAVTECVTAAGAFSVGRRRPDGGRPARVRGMDARVRATARDAVAQVGSDWWDAVRAAVAWGARARYHFVEQSTRTS